MLLPKDYLIEQAADGRVGLRVPAYFYDIDTSAETIKNKMRGMDMMQTMNRNRQLFVELLKEHVPETTVLVTTPEGKAFTATEMMNEISQGSEIGKDFCSSIVRLATRFNEDIQVPSQHESLDTNIFIDCLNELDSERLVYGSLNAFDMIVELEAETNLATAYKDTMMDRIKKLIIGFHQKA